MAIEVFKLFGSIMVDNEKANKSITDTDKKAEGLGSKFIKGIGTVGKWGAAVAGAAAAGAAALFGMANQAAAATDRIDKMSQKLGMSRQAFQEWDFIASQCGLSVEQMSAGMKGLATKMDEASRGNKTVAETFNRLGVSITDTNGKLKSQEQVFEEAVIKLQNMEDGTEKAALATKLFGKTGQELIPLINGAAGSVEEMREKAHELGLVLGDEAIDAGVLFADTVDQVKRSFSAVVTKIGVEVMPIIQTFCDWILENMPIIQEVLGIFFGAVEWFVSSFVNVAKTMFGEFNLSWDTIMQSLKYLWEQYGLPVFEAIEPLLIAIYDNWQIIWESVQLFFKTTWDIIKGIWDTVGKPIFDLIVSIVGVVADFFAERMPAIAGFFSQMVNDIKAFWENNLKPCLDAIGAFINNVLAPAFKFVFNNIIGPVVDSCFKLIKDLWENTLKPILTGITSFLEGVFTLSWSKVWSGLGSIVSGVFSGLVSIVKTPINAIIGMINKMIGGLNKIKLPEWVPGIGGKGINIPRVPMLYKGTNYFEGGMALVGEQGPELVEMPKGAKVNTAEETQNKLGAGITIKIDTFNNNTDNDIESLAENLAFHIKRKMAF